MTPAHHTIASALTSAAFYLATHSVGGTAACFLSGIFIDIDHHLDLWLHKKKIILHPKDLWDYCEKEKGGKLYLIFHAYEWLILLWIWLVVSNPAFVWWGLAVGMTVHLILDQIFNCVQPGVYFILYRFKHKFSKEAIFFPEQYRTMR